MINKWHIVEPKGKRKGCILALPGRAIPGEMMEKFCFHMGLPQTMVAVFEPHELKWYPQPFGADDQTDAIAGLADAVVAVNKRIGILQRAFHLHRNQIAVVGFSAGSVLALQLLAATKKPFAAVVGFAGAIFEPSAMPKALTQTPVLLRHAIDDDCFSWEERYVPMRQALLDNDYNLFVSEKMYGGHGIGVEDAHTIGKFISPYLGYKEDLDT